MSCKGMLEKENRQRSSEEEDGNRLLRCKNSFMLNHASAWAVSLLGHSSPAQPWPGPLVFFGPLDQAEEDSCLCLAGRTGPGVKTIPHAPEQEGSQLLVGRFLLKEDPVISKQPTSKDPGVSFSSGIVLDVTFWANDSTVAKLHHIGYANRLNVLCLSQPWKSVESSRRENQLLPADEHPLEVDDMLENIPKS
ncbi:hypothetical protein Q9966_003043 [Columba livia]|nr:hypothetical protein Q9966_003043 [Columba livia]